MSISSVSLLKLEERIDVANEAAEKKISSNIKRYLRQSRRLKCNWWKRDKSNPFILGFWQWKGEVKKKINSFLEESDRATSLINRNLGILITPESKESLVKLEDPLPRFANPWLSSLLFKGIGYGIVSIAIITTFKKVNWKMTFELFSDVTVASRNLISDWIIAPLMDIWNTIRYKQSLYLINSTSSLPEDIESLKRMSAEYLARKGENDPAIIDLHFEQSLSKPLRGILSGNLITLLLIQLQKSKIDLERALLAMDKLMKSNELNFELLAIIPLASLLYVCFGAGQSWLRSILHGHEQEIFTEIRKKFREIQILQSKGQKNTKGAFGDELQLRGACFVLVDDLCDLWERLPNRIKKRYSRDLMYDLEELINVCDYSVCVRMFHYFHFLHPVPLH